MRRRMMVADFADEDDEELEGEGEVEVDYDRYSEEEEDEEVEGDDLQEEGGDEGEFEESSAERISKLKSLQKELAEVPFGQLLEVQQKMGTKEFKRIRRGISIRRDEDIDDPNGGSSKRVSANAAREKKEIQKRGGKHAPAEQTSKRPVSRFRQVIEIPKKEIGRDPRFSKFSGTLNEGLFKRSYGFLEEYQKSEIEQLRATISKTKDEDEREVLRQELHKKVSKQVENARQEKQKNIDRQWKKTEMESVKQGKKAFYLKKGDKEKLALFEQYKKLGEGKGVDKFLEKRRKKNSASEKRFLPNARR
ncbi:rRNA biogenesis protein rrp36 [Podochytrium sp. JEL0797]|nr:rRNA biogenesis protein rrp36 [Podochytrium sp. JEL0797]